MTCSIGYLRKLHLLQYSRDAHWKVSSCCEGLRWASEAARTDYTDFLRDVLKVDDGTMSGQYLVPSRISRVRVKMRVFPEIRISTNTWRIYRKYRHLITEANAYG